MTKKHTTVTPAFSLRLTLVKSVIAASLVAGLASGSTLWAAQAVSPDASKTLTAPVNPSVEKIKMTLDTSHPSAAQGQAADIIQKLAGKGDPTAKVNILAYTKDMVGGYVGVVVNSGGNNAMPLWADLRNRSVLAGPVFNSTGENISSDMMMSYARAESKQKGLKVNPLSVPINHEANGLKPAEKVEPTGHSGTTPPADPVSKVSAATPVVTQTPSVATVATPAATEGVLNQDVQLSNLYHDLSNGRYSTVSNPGFTGAKKVFVFFDPSCYFCHKMYESVEASAAEFNKAGIDIVYVPVAFLKQESVWQAAQIVQQGWPALVLNEKNYNSQAELGGLPGIKDVSAAINVKANTELFSAVSSMLGKPNAGTPMSIWIGKDGKMHSFGGYPPSMEMYLNEIKD